MAMSVSNIQSNVSALLNKAYNTETNAASSGDAVSTLAKESTTNSDSSTNASASAQVTLGSTDTAPETYTAKGLMQQLRQYQLSNASLIFGNGDESNDDSTGLTSLPGTSSSSDLESMSQDWVSTISESPGKASVMVESSKNNSLNTIFGG
ncbi:MAG TPA: hypothetical protein DGR15_10005 [Methylophilus sp.]|jgi:hypothetical protein|nr:hypothetical protein [Methylophilus sp.]